MSAGGEGVGTEVTEGRCLRPDVCVHEQLCWLCASWTGGRLDSYFSEKVAKGLISEPLEEVLTDREIEWTMRGRLHGDGRRSDQYSPRDPDLFLDEQNVAGA